MFKMFDRSKNKNLSIFKKQSGDPIYSLLQDK